jgi:hypothetical protein|tara:strand:- start:5835 stop:6782 length:948 start_codon:yes stop_codon:yes gene_type:complete
MAAVTDTSKGLISKQFSVLTMGLFLELDVEKTGVGGDEPAANKSIGYQVVPFTDRKCHQWTRKECAEIFDFGMSEVYRLKTPDAYTTVSRNFVCSQKFILRNQPELTDKSAAPIFNGCKLASLITYVNEADHSSDYSHLKMALNASAEIVNMTTLMIAVNDILCTSGSSWEASVTVLKEKLESLPHEVKKRIGAHNASKDNAYLYCMYVLQRLSNTLISLYVRSTDDPNSRLLGLVFFWSRLSIQPVTNNNTQDDFLLAWSPDAQQDKLENEKIPRIPQTVTCRIYETSSIDLESILESSLVPDLKLKYPDSISR